MGAAVVRALALPGCQNNAHDVPASASAQLAHQYMHIQGSILCIGQHFPHMSAMSHAITHACAQWASATEICEGGAWNQLISWLVSAYFLTESSKTNCK